MQSGDLLQQNWGLPQNAFQPKPATVASAATITPPTLICFVTGTTQVANITPPVEGAHMLFLIWTNGAPGATLTTGNILTAITPTQNVPSCFLYDPAQGKYYAWANNVT